MNLKSQNTTIILLAAGSSSRMGQSKQLLSIRGESLLAHTTNIAIQSGFKPVVVVLGSNESQHRAAIKYHGAEIVLNQNWQKGMGTSIKTGMGWLLKNYPNLDSVIIMVCDQPLLTTDHLKKLALRYSEFGDPIIASSYSGTVGVPALFNKSRFDDLVNLPDNQGAKSVIQRHSKETYAIDFPGGATDLDTPEDYNRLLQ